MYITKVFVILLGCMLVDEGVSTAENAPIRLKILPWLPKSVRVKRQTEEEFGERGSRNSGFRGPIRSGTSGAVSQSNSGFRGPSRFGSTTGGFRNPVTDVGSGFRGNNGLRNTGSGGFRNPDVSGGSGFRDNEQGSGFRNTEFSRNNGFRESGSVDTGFADNDGRRGYNDDGFEKTKLGYDVAPILIGGFKSNQRNHGSDVGY